MIQTVDYIIKQYKLYLIDGIGIEEEKNKKNKKRKKYLRTIILL